ncbi:MAG: hypothetical protein RLZZ216_1466 [Cyanobacteriota bacterium]|jgi:3-oxoacyl-[acyl-carrier-protein] synthase III
MKLRNLVAAGLVALLPTASMAATSGTVEATMTVSYSCDISHPAVSTLSPSGNTATATSAQFAFEQNAATDYSLSALIITGPGAGLTGEIVFSDGATAVVTQKSDATSASGGLLGNLSETDGTASFSLTTTDPTFAAGTYSISSTLSCAEAV